MKTVESSRFFVVDLAKHPLQLSEGDLRTWIQGLPLGTYTHPVWGKINITPPRVANFVKNFYDKVRDTDLDIDYEHKEFTSKAAGWIVEAEDRGSEGLWLLVEWTPEALRSLKDKEYRYFSPEFADVWTHPKSGQKYNDVLFGGAITNRPFLKDIMPINLSEFGHVPQQGEPKMDELIKKFAELLGVELSDEDSEEQVEAKLSEAVTKLKDAPKEPAGEDEGLRKLAESNPAIAKLLADREADRRAIVELQASNRRTELTNKLNEFETETVVLAPAAKEKLRNALVKLSEGHAAEVLDAVKDVIQKGIVALGERGTGNAGNRGDDDLVKKFNTRMAELTSGEKALSYADACEAIIKDQPELFDAYNDAQLAGTRKGR